MTRWLIAAYCAVLLIVYGIAWTLPAIGLLYDDAVNLVIAKAIAGGHGLVLESLPFPVVDAHVAPMFPAFLAGFSLVSQQAQSLKLLPLLCTIGWLILTYRLLVRMGASRTGSLAMVLIT